ncbi:Hypothetical predicted protein [Mytilus galloprovincialis]|uniref:MAM domain-containing protein n=1 Tax=Mytilus galloprovincialis TaxID=29158 RepID=A0A8B6F7K0_MYTGA|nr:Hypothetical predicted protein [Mytilus galloprovincialis]
MDSLWINEFLFFYFHFFSISIIHTAELVTTLRYPEQNSVNLSCWQTSIIQIRNITVHAEETSCGPNQCDLSSNDTHTIEDNCNGENSCLVDYNFTSACLRGLRYMNLSYICKHENGTSVSTFEEDFGDWEDASPNNFKWKRIPNVKHRTIASRGYSIAATSTVGSNSRVRINTVNEFMDPICFSLWYQLYTNTHSCSFSIYRINVENHTLLFTTEGKSTSLNQWKNISIDVYEQVPFKLALEANFTDRNNDAILVDETSIAYRPCQGQRIDTACQDINTPMTIECETQFLAGDITLTFQQVNPNIYQKSCQEKFIEKDLNTFCRTFHRSDPCKFRVLDFMTKYKNCIVFNKNISVTYECINNSQTTTNMEISTDSRIQTKVAGVSGGLLVIIIAVCVICRIKRSTTGKQVAKPGKASNAFGGLQYDDERQLNPSSSQCLGQDKMSKNNANVYLPKNLDQSGKELADLYDISDEDGTYDVSSNKKQLTPQNDNNIYSHTADNIYDSGSHRKLTVRNEDTYDHFFGEQTEDEYDTTTRT